MNLCKSCKWYRPEKGLNNKDNYEYGRCFRNPPKRASGMSGSDGSIMSTRPWTGENDTCKKHEESDA